MSATGVPPSGSRQKSARCRTHKTRSSVSRDSGAGDLGASLEGQADPADNGSMSSRGEDLEPLPGVLIASTVIGAALGYALPGVHANKKQVATPEAAFWKAHPPFDDPRWALIARGSVD